MLLRIAEGDEQAFTALLTATSGLLYSFVLRHTGSREVAEEIVQDIYTQIWQTRESLSAIRNFRTYLYVISRNRILNEIKRMARERRRHQAWEQTAATVPQEDSSVREQHYSLIDTAVNLLPPQQHKVWVLNRRQKMTYQEIAAEMQISRETVKTYLQHATQAITRYIKDRM
ncbi:sigma-70 family RNA polymerase sigma factor [Chitinophaga sp. Mgbs1]|uniref:Sigma-70 family RNA polymerase sigma factor n=1 Tax=Chitinophaga solisilvae TaxID=1233460 RepID=A0A9Q5GSR8_9BACT|nr:sigma-70 family RNA polymerase sigma factor [Chitinophaga solisilvae]